MAIQIPNRIHGIELNKKNYLVFVAGVIVGIVVSLIINYLLDNCTCYL